jgi:hypothetical protein
MVVDYLRIYDEHAATYDRLPAENEPDGSVLLPECTGLWWARTAGG